MPGLVPGEVGRVKMNWKRMQCRVRKSQGRTSSVAGDPKCRYCANAGSIFGANQHRSDNTIAEPGLSSAGDGLVGLVSQRGSAHFGAQFKVIHRHPRASTGSQI